MSSNEVILSREVFGPLGVFLPAGRDHVPPVAEQQAAVQRLEAAGCRATWLNEVIGGKDTLVQSGLLLGATRDMAVGTGIANIWARSPQTANAGAAMLADAFPGRFALGLGGGYPFQAESVGREFGRPLATMRDYLNRMESATQPPSLSANYPRLLGVRGPKMLALAAEQADGVVPVRLPSEFTRYARSIIGADRWLVTMLPVIADDDTERAREAARKAVAPYLGMPDYTDALGRAGYSVSPGQGVSDELIDSIVAHGDTAAIASTIDQHLSAGADHVVLMASGLGFSEGIETLSELIRDLGQRWQ